MKTPSLIFLLPLMILASFMIVSSRVLADTTLEAVHDISGKKVRSDQEYYILPVFRGRGGGLTLLGTRNGSCPFDVVQAQHEVSNGLPLTFTSVDPKKEIIRVNTDLNIKFSASTICVQSTVWKLKAFDESTRQWFVTTGGVEGNPSISTVSNWFKIKRYENDYKLVYCPNVCKFCKVICRDIGTYIEDGVRRLALSDQPFKVMFKKV